MRKDGYMVKCWYENKAWMYQLFGTVGEAQGTGDTAASDGNPESRGPSDINGPPENPLSKTPTAGAPGGPLSPLDVGGHQLTLTGDGHLVSPEGSWTRAR